MHSKVLLFTSLSFLSLITHATTLPNQSTRHWYLNGYAGIPLSESGRTQIPAIASQPPLTSYPVYHNEYNLGLSLGYLLQQSWRLEAQFDYQQLSMKQIDDAIGPNTITPTKHSYTRTFSLFGNLFYDLHCCQHWRAFVGAGAGFVDVSNKIVPNPPIAVAPGLFFTKKNLDYHAFGYQTLVGIAYQLTQHVLLNISYKYFATLNTHVVGITNLGPDNYETKQKVKSHTLLFGLTYFLC